MKKRCKKNKKMKMLLKNMKKSRQFFLVSNYSGAKMKTSKNRLWMTKTHSLRHYITVFKTSKILSRLLVQQHQFQKNRLSALNQVFRLMKTVFRTMIL